MKKKINWKLFISILLITQLVGIISSMLSGNIGLIYNDLNKPPLSPPGWIFGIIWPFLYLLMSIAVYMIYQLPESVKKQRAIFLYWVQLFVNFLWPIVFFNFEWYTISVIVILLLDVLVLLTIIYFYSINRSSAYFMIPYLIWILFATYLNIGIAILNR